MECSPVGRQRGVDVTAWQVAGVARLELDVQQRLGAGGHETCAGLGLRGERQPDDRLVHDPALAATDLQDEHVVGVVVEVQALMLPGRRQAGVALGGVARSELGLGMYG